MTADQAATVAACSVAARSRSAAVTVEAVNALHPGVIGDSPKWRGVPDHPHVALTPIGRLVTMDEVAEATEFLLRNTAMNAHDLHIDGGLLVR